MLWATRCTSHAGTKLKLNGRLEEGFEHYRRAITACPAYAPAFYNVGVIHSERRDFAAAKQYYERALQVPISANLQPFCLCGHTADCFAESLTAWRSQGCHVRL